MSFRDTLKLFSIVALMVAAPSIVRADTESDRRIVASKAYVDTKQPIQIGAAGPNSTDAGKLVVVDANGQIAMGTSTVTDLNNKQDKDTTASAGEIGVFNSTGSTVDSNKSFDTTNGTISTASGNDTLVPTSAQVEGYAVAKAQTTGYQVLTTGTTGTVTTEYLKVPITSSGAPASNNAPTNMAQIWLE